MSLLHPVILGGDPFSDVFRGLYNLRRFWKLTDPEYCLAVMKAAYEAGARAFELSFPENVKLFHRLKDMVQEEIVAYGNPTYLQGTKLAGRDLQYYRDRVVKTLVEKYLDPELAILVKDRLKNDFFIVFGYDEEAETLTEGEVESIYLDEDAFNRRLDELSVAKYIMVGGTDADWLVSLNRMDILHRMVEIARKRGFIPLLICHYASEVLPQAEKAGLPVEGYAIPLNREWAWLTKEKARRALEQVSRPVISFMGLGSGSLRHDVRGALEFLFKECGVEGLLFGTTNPINAYNTTRMALEYKERLKKG